MFAHFLVGVADREGDDFAGGFEEVGLEEADGAHEGAGAVVGDEVVGEGRAALPGREALLVDTPAFEGSHWGVITDERVVLDVVRRLGRE